MLKKILSAALAGLILVSAVSCSKTNDEKSKKESEEIPKTTVLTGVYTGSALSCPEGYSFSDSVTPYYDPESGELKLFFSKYEEILDDEGNYADYRILYTVNTYDREFSLVSEAEFELPPDGEDKYYIDRGVLDDNTILFGTSSYDNGNPRYYLVRYNYADGTLTKSDDLTALFSTDEDGWLYVSSICVTPDGMIYLSTENEIAVLSSDFIRQFSIPLTHWIDSMAVSSDGTVYVSSYFDGGSGIAPIVVATKSLGEVITVGESANNITFGSGYDLYYTTSAGVYGMNTTDGSRTMLMSYQNSDVTENYFELSGVIDENTFITLERNTETWDSVPTVYKKSNNIDLSSVKVIEVAVAGYTSWYFTQNVVSYNKAHRDSRIVINDYSVYNTDDDYSAGEKKLATDILNGLYKPDMIIGASGSSSNTAVGQIIENGLFVDLLPLMENDADFDSGDIFDSVRRTFTTSDGKMWGITEQFSVETLVGKSEVIGDRTSWTVDELLDYALSLPEGTSLIEGQSKSNIAYDSLISLLLSSFVDMESNTCSFKSETFYKLLRYIDALPDEYEYEYNDENYYESYHSGKTALYSLYISDAHDWLSQQLIFNGEDTTMIGYPTINGGMGGRLNYSSSYTITTYCENVDVAWDFIKYLIVPRASDSLHSSRSYEGIYNIPIFKSVFRDICEGYYTYKFELYFNGSASWGELQDGESTDAADLYQPGIVAFFTEDDTRGMTEYINDCAGNPATESVPGEVTEIIMEEISSFTSGVKTAEDCAKIIQSRVSLWLSEHE